MHSFTIQIVKRNFLLPVLLSHDHQGVELHYEFSYSPHCGSLTTDENKEVPHMLIKRN